MTFVALMRVILAGIVGIAVVADGWFVGRPDRRKGFLAWSLGCLAGANVVFLLYLFVNHVDFPLNLGVMEGAVLQHFQRAVQWEAIFPEPTPGYVPLAYNPLYYYLSVPFAWVFGTSLFALRFVAILGILGSCWVLFRVTREKTNSAWWGSVAVGLFAAGYGVMDAHLDTTHSDSWMLFSALWGTYLIQRSRTRRQAAIGLILLVASFWFKQHGAFFCIGGVLYLTAREGIRRSWLYWVIAGVLGPGLYWFGGSLVFGDHFHYFTWEVPRQWSEFGLHTVIRLGKFFVKYYVLLCICAAVLLIGRARKWFLEPDIWEIQLLFSFLIALVGGLDRYSSDNNFIAAGAWLILYGVWGAHHLESRIGRSARIRWGTLLLVGSFALFTYDYRAVLTSSRAQASYGDFLRFLNGLGGQTYAPSVGQLQEGFVLYPSAHWVALEDMIRGPGRNTKNHPNTRRLLAPLIDPSGPSHILTNEPLGNYGWLTFLEEYYTLEKDLGDRFEPLRVLPARWDHGWPRYLYSFKGATGQQGDAQGNEGRREDDPLADHAGWVQPIEEGR